MDAETRHQLKQNELAEALQKLRDFNNPTTRFTLVVVGLVLVLYAGWRVWGAYRLSGQAQATQQLGELTATLADEDVSKHDAAVAGLRTLIETADPGLAAAARIVLARHLHDQGLTKPEQRATLLKEAADVLEPAVGNTAVPPTTEAAAAFALATVHESLRELAEARAIYERLSKEARYRGSPYTDLARDRLADLDELGTALTFLPGNAPPPLGREAPIVARPGERPGDVFVGPPAPWTAAGEPPPATPDAPQVTPSETPAEAPASDAPPTETPEPAASE